MSLLEKGLAITFGSLILYYLFRDAAGTNQIITGLAGAYTGAVKTLQGR